MSYRQELGASSERSAEAWFLSRMGGRLVARNFRFRLGEIDLIFEVERVLVFVEVRARLNPVQSGLESVDWKKQRKLARAIRWYLASYRGRAREIRVDVLQWDGSSWTHFPNQWIGP